MPPSTVPGSKAFAVWGGKLLFILRDDDPGIPHPNLWSLPGGAIEAGETPAQAMLREFREEVGVVPADCASLGSHAHPDGTRVHRFLIRLRDDEAAALKLGDEGQRFAFFSLAEVSTLAVSPRLRRYLDAIAPHLRKIVGEGADPESAALGLS